MSDHQGELAQRTTRLNALEAKIRQTIGELRNLSNPAISADLGRFTVYLEEYLGILKPTLSLIDHDLALRTNTSSDKVTYRTIKELLEGLQLDCRNAAHEPRSSLYDVAAPGLPR